MPWSDAENAEYFGGPQEDHRERGEELHTFFSRSMLEKALMTPEEEALVSQQKCPACAKRLPPSDKYGGMCFSQCDGCGDVWVLEA